MTHVVTQYINIVAKVSLPHPTHLFTPHWTWLLKINIYYVIINIIMFNRSINVVCNNGLELSSSKSYSIQFQIRSIPIWISIPSADFTINSIHYFYNQWHFIIIIQHHQCMHLTSNCIFPQFCQQHILFLMCVLVDVVYIEIYLDLWCMLKRKLYC